MNVPTRVGFQTPFTNVTLDLEVKTSKIKGKSQEARANVKLPMHVTVHGECFSGDLYSAIDMLIDTLETPLKKYHDKQKR